jgi:hypothetical protein
MYPTETKYAGPRNANARRQRELWIVGTLADTSSRDRRSGFLDVPPTGFVD